MPYITPQPTIANVLATAAVWSGAGDTSGAMRLLNAHGLTVADMRSYLISKRGLLNGLGAAKPKVNKVPHPKATLARHARGDFTDPPPPYFAGMPMGEALGRFHFSNPFKAVSNAVQKVVGSAYSAVMKPAEIAQALTKGKPTASNNMGVQSYTDSAGNPITAAQYQQLMSQWAAQGYQAQGTATLNPAMATTAPGAVSTFDPSNPNSGAMAVQPAAPVYSVSNLPASVNPANNAPLPSSSDGSTGDNSGGGDTGYQDAASVFNGLGRFKHYAPRTAGRLRSNPIIAGLGANYQAIPAAPGTTAAAPPPDIAAQLNQISFDWPSGTLYVGTNKYSILTTLIGGLVVKSIMWGLSKGGAALKGGGAPAVAGKKSRT
jgi:hypothetical protein